MAWAHSILLPLDPDAETVATFQELQRITCLARCFAEVRSAALCIHFEAIDDAATFMDTFLFLIESMGTEDDTAELLVRPLNGIPLDPADKGKA